MLHNNNIENRKGISTLPRMPSRQRAGSTHQNILQKILHSQVCCDFQWADTLQHFHCADNAEQLGHKCTNTKIKNAEMNFSSAIKVIDLLRALYRGNSQ